MASNENLVLSDLGRAVASGYEENGLQRAQSRHSHANEVQNEHVSLPKADGGRDAWLFLAGCFCIEALTWGECLLQQFTATAVAPSGSPCHKHRRVCNASYRGLRRFDRFLALVVIGLPNLELQLFPH